MEPIGIRILYQPRYLPNHFGLDECVLRLCHAATAHRIYLALANGHKAKGWGYVSFRSGIIVGLPTCALILWKLILSSACFSSIMRLITSVEVIHSQDLTYRLNEEYLWTYVSPPSTYQSKTLTHQISSVAEIASGLLCGCLPILPQFFRHFILKVTSRYKTKGRTSKTSAASISGKPLASSDGLDTHPPLPQGNYLELDEQDKVGV